MKQFDSDLYTAEAKEKWGHTSAYEEYAHRSKDRSPGESAALMQGMNALMAEFALLMKRGEPPHAPGALALAEKLQAYITAHFYTCTPEILLGLGQMYVNDQRFRENIDINGDGTACYISQAIKAYCRQ